MMSIGSSVPEGSTLSLNNNNNNDDKNDDDKNDADAAHNDFLLLSWLALFRQERHSLRLSASNIAALAGYHPWKDLPLLLFDLIYQGRRGQQLLKQDSENLSIELIAVQDDNNETALLQLAAKAGVSVQAALDVKSGKRTLHSVQDAQDLKVEILKKARLTDAGEMKELVESVRSAIDTSFGTHNEDDALDQYERITGWPVTRRNAEVMIWNFDSCGQPGQVRPLRRQHRDAPSPVTGGVADTNGTRRCHVLVLPDSNDGGGGANAGSVENKRTAVDEICDTLPVSIELGQPVTAKDTTNERHDLLTDSRPPKPFFSILGSIDGIREELMMRDRPISKLQDDDDDDDSFCTRPVIVECKHRMKAIKKSPPLYDQIQAVVYMLMYQVNQADIIQVLRSKRRTNKRRNDEDKTMRDRSLKQQDDISDVRSTTHTTTATTIATRSVQQQQVPTTTTTIAVHRISLDDTTHQHRFHWEQTVLPRVRGFVDVVYDFRADDHRRYRLLHAIASKSYRHAWTILFEACPWLERADTAFRLIMEDDATAATATAALGT